MIQINVEYQGDLVCQLEHQASGSLITTDAPVDNMGKGSTFSPTDLCAASLVSCIVTTLGILAQKNGFVLAPCSASVKKIMSTDSPRRIVELPVSISLQHRYSEHEFAILEKAALTCPVKQSLSENILVSIEWV